jgi:hypothetical protein
MSQSWVSPDLPPTATRYAIPAGVLKNRSLAFSDPYTPAP